MRAAGKSLLIAVAAATLGSTCGTSSGAGGGPATPTPAGPGANLICPSTGQNAFLTYGTAGFFVMNDWIFSGVFENLGTSGISTELGESFALVGSGVTSSTLDPFNRFEGEFAAYLVYAYGGPYQVTYTDREVYTGPQDMSYAHSGLGITQDQYAFFVSNIMVGALTTAGVAAGDIGSCIAPMLLSSAFEASIVGQ